MFRQRYQQVVLIKDTNSENGPGHASVSVIKSSDKGDKINHTSYYPGPVGSLINGLTLGSVPVRGRLADDHKADLDEADHVLVKEISKEEYKKAKKVQQQFTNNVEQGHHTYSVFGSLNPFASGFTSLYSSCRNAVATAKHYKKVEGFELMEDHTGIPVFSNDHHVVVKKAKVHNCVSSTRKVLKAANVNIDHPVAPTFFTQPLLDDHGFKKVDKEEFKSTLRV